MAAAWIAFTWDNGQSIVLEASDDTPAYPDCLGQLVTEVLRMYRETVLQP